MMNDDRKWWVVVDRASGKQLASSMRATRKETFEAESANVFEGVNVDLVEISAEEAVINLEAAPSWVKQLIKLRDQAQAKPVYSVSNMKPSEIPVDNIDGWRVRLSLDATAVQPYFAMSVKLIRNGIAKMKEIERLGSILDALGAIPRPEPIGDDKVCHFRWPADVDLPVLQ